MSDQESLKLVGEFEIAKLNLGPGDILIIRFAKPMTQDTARRAQDYFRRPLPSGVKAAIFDTDVELSVLTRAEIKAKAA